MPCGLFIGGLNKGAVLDDCTEIDRNYSPGADIRLFRWGVPVRVSVKERRFLLFFSEKAKSRQEAARNISHDDGELK